MQTESGAHSDAQPLTRRIAATAHALGVGERTVYRYLADGRLKGLRVGGVTLVLEHSIQDLLRNSPAWTPATPVGAVAA